MKVSQILQTFRPTNIYSRGKDHLKKDCPKRAADIAAGKEVKSLEVYDESDAWAMALEIESEEDSDSGPPELTLSASDSESDNPARQAARRKRHKIRKKKDASKPLPGLTPD